MGNLVSEVHAVLDAILTNLLAGVVATNLGFAKEVTKAFCVYYHEFVESRTPLFVAALPVR
eukprot:180608-Amorphochlora_amoeboformis.AAC.2